jgi:hypothetical protein
MLVIPERIGVTRYVKVSFLWFYVYKFNTIV